MVTDEDREQVRAVLERAADSVDARWAQRDGSENGGPGLRYEHGSGLCVNMALKWHLGVRTRRGAGIATAPWVLVAALLALASGCARPDWIEHTLVTVDVTGRWTGNWFGPIGGGGPIGMTLQQNGPKATGNIELTGGEAHNWSGPIAGTVEGDVLSFRIWDGRLRGEVIVAGDEMSGTVTLTPISVSGCCPGKYMSGTKTLKLQRQP
jgi:hypothetical protein